MIFSKHLYYLELSHQSHLTTTSTELAVTNQISSPALMASHWLKAQTSIKRQLTELLERFRTRTTRGLYMRIRYGVVTVDTLAYSTNTEWRKFKVRAADRERAFMDWVRPYAETMKQRIQVHPEVWKYTDAVGCIYYDEGGKVEVTCNVENGEAFDRFITASDFKWDGTRRVLDTSPDAVRARDQLQRIYARQRELQAFRAEQHVLIDLTNA